MGSKSPSPMTSEAASRIQSQADRTGTNQDFKARAQHAAAQQGGGSKPSQGGKGGSGRGKK